MDGLEFVRTYLDDCLCLTSGTWEDDLEKLEQVHVRLKSAGLKVNAQKSFYGQSQLEYRGWYPAITKESASDQKFDGTKNT